MSPCTKRLQRSTRSLAPFSGLNAKPCAWASGVKTALPTPSDAAAATPAEPSRNLRRLNCFMAVSFRDDPGSRGNFCSGCKACAGGGVEQVGALQVGHDPDRAAGREPMALAEHHEDVCVARAALRPHDGA